MKLDLVYVSYNSSKWIDDCFASIMRSDYNLKDIAVYVVDNASTDDTLQKLEAVKERYKEKLAGFNIIQAGCNLGFGKANNLGFSKGNAEIVCFFNIDTELCADTLSELVKDIAESDEKAGLWELRQFPYEHPKIYDPLTHETYWSSAAAFAMRRELFRKLNGFDDAIFMYAEDVDLSWRLRSLGYTLKYCPKSVIWHYSYQKAGEIKPNQYLNSVINNLLLRYRFGTMRNIIKGNLMVIKQLLKPEVFEGSRKMLFRKYLQHFGKIFHFANPVKWGKDQVFEATFFGFDYSAIREGAFYENHFPESNALVSVIVRTCGRPDVLRETIQSLRLQTYPNIEIVVVEDGPEVSRQMLETEFSDLNILYKASGEKVGRSRVGNMAMEMAHGKYLNFLDDDDLFYADHVEVLVASLENCRERAAYALAFETPVDVFSKSPYRYKVYEYLGVYKQKFNRILLCHHNYIPIQCIMFEKTLFEEFGGLDESLDALEDWDLWVRYAMHTDFYCVEKTTSIYRVPYNHSVNEVRQGALDDALLVVRAKHQGYCTNMMMTAAEMCAFTEAIFATVEMPSLRSQIKARIRRYF